MRSIKLNLFVIAIFACIVFVGSAGKAYAATVTVGQDSSKSATANYFYYNPGNKNAQEAINNALGAAYQGASSSNHGIVNIENASSPYIVNSHIVFRGSLSNVDLVGQSRDGVVLRIAAGITPVYYDESNPYAAGWGGDRFNSKHRGAIVMVWTGVQNINIKNITFYGSWEESYQSLGRGQGEFDLINIQGASNVHIDNCFFTHGADDGVLCGSSNNVEVSNCVFDMVNHDCFNMHSSSNSTFDHNFCAMRTNSGARCSGDGTGCYIYDNEFKTGTGGGSGVELQDSFRDVKIYHNYFHDINASGKYGAIGYPGQSPSGSGHEYYDNLFVSCVYAVSSNVPSSAVTHNNIMINTGTTVGGGTGNNNITNESGYVFSKNGANKQVNMYWTVTSGPLTSAFSGIKVGIDSAATGDGDTGGGGGGTTCTSWTYVWGPCVGGNQTPTSTVGSPAGCTGGSPVTSRSCYPYSEDSNLPPLTPAGDVVPAPATGATTGTSIFPTPADVPATAKDTCIVTDADPGLVPCGRNFNSTKTPWNECDVCNLCAFGLMIQLIIEFLIKLSGIAAVLAIILGGVYHIIAAGDVARMTQAKKLIEKIVVGFAIILLAWLIVDCVFTTFGFINPLGGSWHIMCGS